MGEAMGEKKKENRVSTYYFNCSPNDYNRMHWAKAESPLILNPGFPQGHEEPSPLLTRICTQGSWSQEQRLGLCLGALLWDRLNLIHHSNP